VAAQAHFGDIWRATKGKLGAEVTSKLADTFTPEDVDGIIRPLLGTHDALRGPLQVDYRTFHPFENVRLFKTMPGPRDRSSRPGPGGAPRSNGGCRTPRRHRR
jgi:hypothetical protein